MTRPDAEAMLAAEPTGSFLVRQRLNTEGLALALKAPGKIRHYLVVENSGHWRLMTGSPSPFFPSLDELIECVVHPQPLELDLLLLLLLLQLPPARPAFSLYTTMIQPCIPVSDGLGTTLEGNL